MGGDPGPEVPGSMTGSYTPPRSDRQSAPLWDFLEEGWVRALVQVLWFDPTGRTCWSKTDLGRRPREAYGGLGRDRLEHCFRLEVSS